MADRNVPRYGLSSEVFDGLSTIGTFRHQIIIGGIDFTDYVLSAHVRKCIAEPVGEWTIWLRPVVGENNLIRRIPVDINDLVEIRIDRNNPAGGPIKLVMRGFLNNEEMLERPAQDLAGAPSRSHMLSGSDIAKLLEKRKIYVPKDISETTINLFVQTRVDLFNEFSSSIKEGLEQRYQSGELDDSFTMPLSVWADFFLMHVYASEYKRIVNESRPADMRNFEGVFLDVNLPMMNYKGKSIERFWVTLSPLINNETGSMWQFIEYYCTKPFVELFLEDSETRSTLKLRWTPHKVKRGLGDGKVAYEYPKQGISNKDWFDTSKLEHIKIRSTDIIERRLRRSEQDRYTYFFTNFNAFMVQNGIPIVPTGTETDDPSQLWINPYFDDAGIRQFGYRPLAVYVPWFASENNVQQKVDEATGINEYVDQFSLDIELLLKDLNKWLIETYTFTDQLWQGYLIVPGNSNIKIGQELTIEDTGEEYYIESVEHNWSVFPTPQFTTRIGVSRGTLPESFIPARNTMGPEVAGKVRATFGTIEVSNSSTEPTSPGSGGGVMGTSNDR